MTDREYVTNHITDGAFIRDRTHHKVKKVDGHMVTAKCGSYFHAEDHQFDSDESDLRDRKKCNRCWGSPDA